MPYQGLSKREDATTVHNYFVITMFKRGAIKGGLPPYTLNNTRINKESEADCWLAALLPDLCRC